MPTRAPTPRVTVAIIKSSRFGDVLVRGPDKREAWIPLKDIAADNTVPNAVFERRAAKLAERQQLAADPVRLAHYQFDRAAHTVVVEDEMDGNVLLAATWEDVRKGQRWPLAVVLRGSDVFSGAHDHVVGALLRNAVAVAAAEEGLAPHNANIVIRVDGCKHEFNAAGEIPAFGTAPA